MNMPIRAVCSICHGKGVVPCHECKGVEKIDPTTGHPVRCQICQGEYEETCPSCGRKGHNN